MTKVLLRLIAIQATAVALMAFISPRLATADPGGLLQLEESIVNAAQKITPSVVSLSSSRAEVDNKGNGEKGPSSDRQLLPDFFGRSFELPFGSEPDSGGQSPASEIGSGFIVSADGLILTNSHVVRDVAELSVTLFDKRTLTAEVVGVDAESDLALVRVNAQDLTPVEWGDSRKLKVGQIVLAAGSPFGLKQTVSFGIISAIGRTNVGVIDYEEFIQTDAPINPGNSGGPLFNVHGHVIGVTTAIATRSGASQGVGFAIPSDSAKIIVDHLLRKGKVKRGVLGISIQDLNEPLAKSFGRNETTGALVTNIIENSPAATSGLREGDIIIKFNDTPVSCATQIRNLVSAEAPQTDARLTVYREGAELDLRMKLGERTSKTTSLPKPPSSQVSNQTGLQMEKVSNSLAKKMKLKKGEGIHVKAAKAGFIGHKMGLKAGDVIVEVDGKPISDVIGFNKAFDEARAQKAVRLKIRRGDTKIYVASPQD
jgi:serine protease Do